MTLEGLGYFALIAVWSTCVLVWAVSYGKSIDGSLTMLFSSLVMFGLSVGIVVHYAVQYARLP